MNRSTNTNRRKNLFMPAGLIAAAGMAMGLGAVAQAQYQDDRYDGDRYEEHYEWEPGTGVHEEEWYDPTDWFDDDYNERYIDYEETGNDDSWYNDDDYDDDNAYYDNYYNDDNNVLNDNYDEYYDNGYEPGYYDNYYTGDQPARDNRDTSRNNNRDNQRAMNRDRQDRYNQGDNRRNQGRYDAQNQRNTQLRGQINGWTRINMDGQREDQTLVRVRLNNGRSELVILGPEVDLSSLDVQNGDDIAVYGQRDTINNRQVIKARQVRVGDRTIRVNSWNQSSNQGSNSDRMNRSQSGSQWQDRQRDNRYGQRSQDNQRDSRYGQRSQYDQQNRDNQSWDQYGDQSRDTQRQNRYTQQNRRQTPAGMYQDRDRQDQYSQQQNRRTMGQDRNQQNRFAQQNSRQGDMQPQAHEVQSMIRQWPSESRKIAETMLSKYGQPAGATPDMLIWKDTGAFTKTIVHKNPAQHDFPMAHKQVLEQCVDMKIPASKAEDIAKFDTALIVYYSDGAVASRCHDESMNILALNLVDKIVNDEMSVQEARQKFKKDAQAYMNGEKPEMTRQIAFNNSSPNSNQTGSQSRDTSQDTTRESDTELYSNASQRDD